MSGAALLLLLDGANTAVLAEPGTRPLVATFAARDFPVTFHDDPLMPRHIIITIGETREPIVATLSHTPDGEVEPLPLGGAAVTAHFKGVETDHELLDVACTVVNPDADEATDPDAGAVELAPAALSSLVPDNYQVRYKADFGGGQIQWWPSADHLILTARARFTED